MYRSIAVAAHRNIAAVDHQSASPENLSRR
jgi:hypothetical protein